MISRQKKARENQVVMYRSYRAGDLPDVQITHKELIVPFQALAQVKLLSVLLRSLENSDGRHERVDYAIQEYWQMILE